MNHMAWKPRLPPVGTDVVPMERRKWVAVAESHAEQAVNLFVNIMKNQRLPYKMRMEAATRIVMIAGATFRGERVDGNGRPAANLPSGVKVTRLGHDALREALKQLPPGSVVESPDELAEGEVAVVLTDSEHSRKPTGKITQSTVAATVIGEADPEEAHALKQERLQYQEGIETEKLAKKAEKDRVVTDPLKLVSKLFRTSDKEKKVLEVVDRKLGIKERQSERRQEEAKSLLPGGNVGGDREGSEQAGQEPKLDSAGSMEDSQTSDGEVA
jgi:hypothetical protein